MSSRSFLRGAFWTLIALILAGHALGGWYYSSQLIEDGFVPDPDPTVLARGDLVLEEVSYTTQLGSMDAWVLPTTSNTWVIHVHSKGTTPAEAEFLFKPLQEAGYSQLSITYRNDENQPSDPSGYYQYGETEWEDVAAAVEFVEDQGANKIIFSGFGTGSSHILSYVYKNNLDKFKGIILDSPNIDMGDTVDFRGSMEELPVLGFAPPRTLAWVAKFLTSLRIGVNWKSLDYIERGKGSLRIPVLDHHGVEDTSVPVSQSVSFAETHPDLVRLIQVQGAGHLGSFDADPDAYLESVLEFLAEVG